MPTDRPESFTRRKGKLFLSKLAVFLFGAGEFTDQTTRMENLQLLAVMYLQKSNKQTKNTYPSASIASKRK